MWVIDLTHDSAERRAANLQRRMVALFAIEAERARHRSF